MNIRKIFCSLLALLMVFALTGCETYDAFKAAFIDKNEEELSPIKIGVFEPLSGSSAEGASAEISGIELAHELYPEILGRKIELVYSDNQSDVSSCQNAVENLLAQDVKFIIGSYKSILTLAASDAIKEAGVPAIACTNTNPLITATNPYYFRVCCIDSYEGESAADYVLNSVKTTLAAVLISEGNDYASTLAASFRESFVQSVGAESYTKVISNPALFIEEETTDSAIALTSDSAIEENISDSAISTVAFVKDSGKTDSNKSKGTESGAAIEIPEEIEVTCDYAPSITLPASLNEEGYLEIFRQLEELDPDVVYFPSSLQEASTIIPLSRLLGYNFTWLGTSQWNEVALNDVYYTIDFDPEEELSEMTATFNKLYSEKYGENTVPTDSVALGFDAYLLALEAITEKGPYAAGWQYAEALGSITDMKGATGNISMDPSGNPIKEITVEHSVTDEGKSIAVYSSIPSNKIREEIVVTTDAAVEK